MKKKRDGNYGEFEIILLLQEYDSALSIFIKISIGLYLFSSTKWEIFCHFFWKELERNKERERKSG